MNLNLNNSNSISDALNRKGNNNNNNKNEGVVSSNYYDDNRDYSNVNNNLVNLNKLITDIHDNAYFTNLSKLNHLKEFPTYSNYQYLFKHDNNKSSSSNFNSKLSSHSCSSSSNLSNSSQNDKNNIILLNNWFDMIHIDLVKLTNSHNSSTSKLSFCSSHQSTSTLCKADCLTNIIDQTNLFDLSFIKFFLDALNGNFFKLKHLVDYLNDLILSTNSNDTMIANELILINEIITFFNLPCTFTLFQLALRTKFYTF